MTSWQHRKSPVKTHAVYFTFTIVLKYIHAVLDIPVDGNKKLLKSSIQLDRASVANSHDGNSGMVIRLCEHSSVGIIVFYNIL